MPRGRKPIEKSQPTLGSAADAPSSSIDYGAIFSTKNMPISSFLLTKGRATVSCGPAGVLDSLRDGPGDVLSSVEAGGKPVLGQCERSIGSGACVRVASADTPHPEHVLDLVRVREELADGVAQPPRGWESEDLVNQGHRNDELGGVVQVVRVRLFGAVLVRPVRCQPTGESQGSTRPYQTARTKPHHKIPGV